MIGGSWHAGTCRFEHWKQLGSSPNGTDLSDFRSFRGSGILPRSVAAVGHSSRLGGAPTRRCALSQCHRSYGGFLSRGRFAEPFPSLGFAGASFACAMRLRFAGVLGWRMAGEFRFNFFSFLPMTSHARYRARQPAQKPAGSRHRCVQAVSIAALNPPVGLFLEGETSNAKCSSRG